MGLAALLAFFSLLILLSATAVGFLLLKIHFDGKRRLALARVKNLIRIHELKTTKRMLTIEDDAMALIREFRAEIGKETDRITKRIDGLDPDKLLERERGSKGPTTVSSMRNRAEERTVREINTPQFKAVVRGHENS